MAGTLPVDDLVNSSSTIAFHRSGTVDPSVIPVDARAGSLYLKTSSPRAVYQKDDNGLSTNWILLASGPFIESSLVGTSITYKPGGIASPGVYITWPDVMDALSERTAPTNLYFDDSVISPAVIPAGGPYEMDRVSWKSARPSGVNAQIQVADGVSFSNLNGPFQSLFITFLNSAPVESLGADRLLEFNETIVSANGTAPVWELTDEVDFTLNRSALLGSGTAAVIDIQPTERLALFVYLGSTLSPSAVTGDGTTEIEIAYADETSSIPTQTGFTGTLSIVLLSQAQFMNYPPAVPGNWITPPTNVQQALDELASEQIVLSGGSRGAPLSITAVGGITSSVSKEELQFVQGDGGPIIVTANPQITPGTIFGQKLHLKGTDDVNTLQLSNGTGLELNGSCVLKNGSLLNLIWDGTIWGEESRNDI